MTTTPLPNLNFTRTAKSAFSPIMTAIAGVAPVSEAQPDTFSQCGIIRVQQADGSYKLFAVDPYTMVRVEIDNSMALEWILEWTPEERAELHRRYEEAQENPPTAEFLRNAPDILDPDFG